MSKIALTPNASGTGTFSIAAPGTNTDRTLTLPDAAGTIATTADVSAGDAGVTATLIGVGQTWQSVTRSPATNYQNTTGRPIMVFSSMSNTSGIQNFQVSTDASTWVNAGNSQSANAPNQVIVPNNHYYRWTQTVGTTVISVTELR
jgi:hypothetical protein